MGLLMSFQSVPELPEELPQPAAPANTAEETGTCVIGAPAFTGMMMVDNEEADDNNNDGYAVCVRLTLLQTKFTD